LFLGMRQGEALALAWSDVDLDADVPVVYVTRSLERVKAKGLVFGEPKSEKSTRAIPLMPAVAAKFRQARARHLAKGGRSDGLAFGIDDDRPMDPKADWKQWRALLGV